MTLEQSHLFLTLEQSHFFCPALVAMGKGKGGGREVEVKFSDLNTESSIFDLRPESVIGDPALRSGG